MSEMVDRVAKALCAASVSTFPAAREVVESNWHQFAPEYADKFRKEARIAIAAMLEPCDGMMQAGFGANINPPQQQDGSISVMDQTKHIWRHMIIEALK